MPLTEAQEKKVKLAFLVFDKDKGTGESAGSIEATNMAKLVQSMGLSIPEEVIEKEVQRHDDGDGEIVYKEFLVILDSLMNMYEPQQSDVRAAFHLFSEGTNELKIEDLAEAISKYGNKEHQDVLDIINKAEYKGDIEAFLATRMIAE